MARLGLAATDLAALGITNQRETSIVWNRTTGRPYCNAIVWQDTRTDRIVAALESDGKGEVIRRKAGLPPATYFAGAKVQWILENVDGVRAAADRGEVAFGTVDSWLTWNLTGGSNGGMHVTDVTNASRTMLMNLETLDWDDELLGFFDIPPSMLPADQTVVNEGSVRRGGDAVRLCRCAADRHAGRPAGGDVRSGVLRAWRCQEHLRHRQLPAAQHRHRASFAARTVC